MDRAPPSPDPPPLSPSAGLPTSRANRLRRSSRARSQQPWSPAARPPGPAETAHLRHKAVGSQQPPAFKTPTRMTRSKYAPCAESPNNDVEFHQDIVWDANSPSPVRAGRRGKSRAAGAAIGISEIVRRIAPMHGRPAVVEPTLQEWIGDSAAIPCTPEVHHPRRKSPRSNSVDDLLKLAKQFDFNMFQQDEEQAEDMHQQTLELLSEDILEYQSGFQDGPQVPLAEPPPPAPEAASQDASCMVHGPQDQNMEDDLELLFDEPTQRISGRLSQVGLPGSMDTPCFNSGAAVDAPPRPIPPVSTHGEAGPVGYQLDDDWDNDDFLNDASFLEMTQNPQGIVPPKYCSTQSGPDGALHDRRHPSGGTEGQGGGFGVVPKNEPRMTKNQTTFKLDANPVTLRAIGAVEHQASNTNYSVPQTEALSRVTRPISGSHLTRLSQPAGAAAFKSPAAPQPKTPLSKSGAKPNSAVTPAATAHTMKENRPTRSSNIRETANANPPHGRSWRPTPPVAPASADDPLDQNLDELFSSESAWGDEDGDEDDLLCLMCDDLENQAEVPGWPAGLRQHPAPPTAPSRGGNHRKVPDTNDVPRRSWTGAAPTRLRSPTEHPKSSPLSQQPGGPCVNAFTGSALSDIKECFNKAPSDYGRGSGVSNVQRHGGGPSLRATAGDKAQFSFKKPPSPSIPVMSTGPAKCSLVEIERKKRQALERRRQRSQATQKLGAPT